jgi:arginine decarboxylase
MKELIGDRGMPADQNPEILIVDNELRSDTAGGTASRELVNYLKGMEFKIIEATTTFDGELMFLTNSEIGCVLLNWDLRLEKEGTPRPSQLIDTIRRRNRSIPIFLLTEKITFADIPLDVIRKIDGYVWKLEDTPHFVAGRIEEAAEKYLRNCLPPFFGELAKYTGEYKYAWHTPGHTGGVAFLKTAAGGAFFRFFGENAFRSDLSVSVPELGSLMEHSGVLGEAETNAARVFGADKTYFVTNGTSTANRIVFNGCVNPGDIVLVDRNCHKSVMYSIILTGAIPIYLVPTRNSYGIIGPIHVEEFSRNTLRKKLESNPRTKTHANGHVKLAVITNSTYDGLCYNVKEIKNKLTDVVDNLLFDEAWYGYAKFHPLYRARYAMSRGAENPNHPVLFATQSTHKVLAAFSQGSMIHVRHSHKGKQDHFDHDRFNEALDPFLELLSKLVHLSYAS